MTLIQQIVPPAKIESELMKIWEGLVKENKMRASLFNLIVFNRYSERTDYIRSIVQKVVEKFPCRILFISEDPNPEQSYLKTAVSVVKPQAESTIACDHIDIGAAGAEIERVPYLILPHILPDLPVTLLWAEDPSISHPLFKPLTALANRVIFDSESADNLLHFSKTVLDLKKTKSFDIADLNWARTEGWRDLLAFVFDTPERVKELRNLSRITLQYNARPTEFFCHLKIQSMYLLSWLSGRLGWDVKKTSKTLSFEFSFENKPIAASIGSSVWDHLGPGTVISINFETKTKLHFDCTRLKERPHSVNIQISSQEKCDLPYQFLLGQTATGQSLVQEICMKGTSGHYLEMLKLLQSLDKDQLC
jgi:glucose-6-phosphate dehydrogenase assembly protein OpcA